MGDTQPFVDAFERARVTSRVDSICCRRCGEGVHPEAIDLHERACSLIGHQPDRPDFQIERLRDFLHADVPEELRPDESPADCAIRLIRATYL